MPVYVLMSIPDSGGDIVTRVPGFRWAEGISSIPGIQTLVCVWLPSVTSISGLTNV